MKFAPTKCFVMSVILKNSRFQFSYALCNVQLAFKNTSASMYVKLAVAVWRSKKEGYKSLSGSFKGISHRAVDLLRNAHTHPWCVRLLNTPRLLGLHTQRKVLTLLKAFNTAQHDFLTMITAASSISSMLTDMNWPSLQSRRRICDLGMFFIKYIEVKSKSPYPITSSLCLRMAVQGRVTTLSSGSHTLQLTLRNTIFM